MVQPRKRKQAKTKRFDLPEAMRKIVNVQVEDGRLAKPLQQISDRESAVLLAFIAPYTSVRVSPIEERTASIRLAEEWGIEYVLSEIEEIYGESKKPRLYFLINSPGGLPACCYNIAHMIQAHFPNITVFVPQVALSGGTLLALSGNKLVMGEAGRLSPIDVQVPYGDSTVSAYSISKALSRLEHYFRTKTVEEAPYPYRAMADRLDPVILEDWTTSLIEVGGYADEILEKAKYPKEKREAIVKTLVLTDKTHSYVVHRERAKAIGLNVSDSLDDSLTLNVMRQWLTEYSFEEKATHCIRYVIPSRRKNSEQATGISKGKARKRAKGDRESDGRNGETAT